MTDSTMTDSTECEMIQLTFLILSQLIIPSVRSIQPPPPPPPSMTSTNATEESLFGQANDIQDNHLAAMQETEDFKRKKKSNMDMRRRIKQIYSWLQLNYNDEYCMEGGVVALTPEQKNDPSVHHYGNDFDLCYSRFNVTYLKVFFIGSIKLKGNGKHCSFVHIRKFRDAIKFGAEEAKQDLPAEFDREMKSFLHILQERGDKPKEAR